MPIVETEDRHPGAFDHIICPCCGSDEWYVLLHDAAYCNNCNTQCRIRETSGDQGFIAEFDSEGYTYLGDGIEIIPESEERGQRASEKWLGTNGEYYRYWFSAYAEYDDDRDIDWIPAWERPDPSDRVEWLQQSRPGKSVVRH